MSLLTKELSSGNLRGVIYTFENAGDILPMHSHGERDVHITIVARGRLKCHGPIIGESEIREGQVIDWGVGIQHEFIALTANARLVNIIKSPLL